MSKRYLILAKTYDKRGRIIAVGTNNYTKTHPTQQYFAKKVGLECKDKLHAEIQALVRSSDKKVYKLTVERYLQDGSPAMAKPCRVCQEAIVAYGVSVVEYTTSEGFVKETI